MAWSPGERTWGIPNSGNPLAPHCRCGPGLPSVPGPLRGIPSPLPPGRKPGAALRHALHVHRPGVRIQGTALSFLGVGSGGQGSSPFKPAAGECGVRYQEEFTKGNAWADSCQHGGVVSDLCLKQQVTGPIDKPGRVGSEIEAQPPLPA